MIRLLAFLFCGLVWGSSYYWIKIALEEIGPVTLVALRLAFALVGLAVVCAARKAVPLRDWRSALKLAVLACLSPGIPFLLISWSETRIDSGVASILNGTMPLFVTLIAHFTLADERLTVARFLGLVTGFLGIVLLFSRDLGHGWLAGRGLGELAMLASSIFYAASAVYARRLLRVLSPLTVTFGQMLFGDLLAWALVPLLEPSFALPQHGITWLALAWLGLLGSCLTFLAYHWLVTHWGATRTSLTNYIVPVVGLALGFWFRGEPADWRLAAGAILILGGIAIVNHKALISLLNRGRYRS